MRCLPNVPLGTHHSRSEHHWRSQHHLRDRQTSFKKRTFVGRQKCVFCWRRERDSNPRVLAHKLISSQPRYDHFDISPYMIKLKTSLIFVAFLAGRPVMSCCGARNFFARLSKFRPLPLLFARFICHRQRSQTSPLRYLSVLSSWNFDRKLSTDQSIIPYFSQKSNT